jgi:hypothetical protein
VEIPADLRERHLVKLSMKEHLQEYSNYRGIILLSVPGKVLYRIINIKERVKTAVDAKLSNEQAKYRPNRSRIDQI